MKKDYLQQSKKEKSMESPVSHSTANALSGGSYSNFAVLNSLGLDTKSDPNLGAAMASRMQAQFGGFSAGSGVIQRMPLEEREHPRARPQGDFNAIRRDLEAQSSVSLSDVEVHYNSPKPAEIGALAYARGTDIYMGPGQEKHLGHELTHVVQQKQGLVRSNGLVDGMPVNTSPALEQAADNMQVSAAPAVASPSGSDGVVQGVFQDKRGKKLSKKDVKVMTSMMKGAYGNMIDRSIEGSMGSRDRARFQQNDDAYIQAFQDRKASFASRIAKMSKSKEVFSPEDILGKEIGDTQASIGENALKNLSSGLTIDFHGYSGSRVAPLRRAKDTREGYEQTESGFQLPTEAMAGIEEIAEFDPSKNKADALTEDRMGNSATFATLEPQEREKKTNEFKDATEVSRKGAVALRKSKEDVSFGSLFQLFSNLNKAVRPQDETGGTLRAKNVHTRTIQGVGSAQLGEDAFQTFSTIAHHMNEIKRIPDRDLQRTQAIHLASFANQMLISEHMFDDGNGRTCRLFADSILQTFGLPPHSPQAEAATTSGTIGEAFDFNRGANVMLAGVRASDQTLREAPEVPQKKKSSLFHLFKKK